MNIDHDASRKRRIFLSLGLGTMLSYFSKSGMAIEKGNGQIITDDLIQRGVSLRSDIDLTYKKLKDEKKLVFGYRGNDIKGLVAKYIPLGTSFDDAEKILSTAGFKVYPRPSANPQIDRPDKYDVSAWLDIPDQGFGNKVQVIVSLSPKVPGDYSNVSAVSAGLFYDSI